MGSTPRGGTICADMQIISRTAIECDANDRPLLHMSRASRDETRFVFLSCSVQMSVWVT